MQLVPCFSLLPIGILLSDMQLLWAAKVSTKSFTPFLFPNPKGCNEQYLDVSTIVFIWKPAVYDEELFNVLKFMVDQFAQLQNK